MTSLKILTAAALLASAVATPVLAQDVPSRAQVVNHANDPSNPYNRHRAWRETYRDSNAFWPGEVAAGVVGGAIGAAGAIATAPFRDDWYAYNNGYAYDDGYMARNGIVCRPGTIFRGEDGRRHLCQ